MNGDLHWEKEPAIRDLKEECSRLHKQPEPQMWLVGWPETGGWKMLRLERRPWTLDEGGEWGGDGHSFQVSMATLPLLGVLLSSPGCLSLSLHQRPFLFEGPVDIVEWHS